MAGQGTRKWVVRGPAPWLLPWHMSRSQGHCPVRGDTNGGVALGEAVPWALPAPVGHGRWWHWFWQQAGDLLNTLPLPAGKLCLARAPSQAVLG